MRLDICQQSKTVKALYRAKRRDGVDDAMSVIKFLDRCNWALELGYADDPLEGVRHPKFVRLASLTLRVLMFLFGIYLNLLGFYCAKDSSAMLLAVWLYAAADILLLRNMLLLFNLTGYDRGDDFYNTLWRTWFPLIVYIFYLIWLIVGLVRLFGTLDARVSLCTWYTYASGWTLMCISLIEMAFDFIFMRLFL